ncbi:hypothetical protein IGI04_035376 [Brassica rapa subsp. trilocularis]|uniref:Uncharacterized protein n=1 Tax=Brassica rapa subsp. trilocularis TaxID=1813537 RepID=A0ABQ7LDP0_BRACM|nr:hypothetical protein IGI04_035376 [Brassica rapa subsp. trilocularis]
MSSYKTLAKEPFHQKAFTYFSSSFIFSSSNYDWFDPLSGYVGNPSPGPAIIIKHLFYSLRVLVSIEFKLSTKTSPNPTDESSSRSFTSLLTVLGSNSWLPPWGMGKYLRGRLNWSPFCHRLTVLADRSLVVARLDLSQSLGADHSRAVAWLYLSRSLNRSHHSAQIILSSLDRRVVTRPFFHHSTAELSLDNESSLDRRVVTRPLCPHSTNESSLDRSIITLPFCRHSAQSVLSQSLDSICVVAWLDLSRSFSRHSTAESSLDRRVVTRPTSRHSTDKSSLDRRVITRPTSRHSTDKSSLDRSIVTRPMSRHSTDESTLDRRVDTRPTSRHSTSLVSTLAVTRHRSFSRSPLARSLAVTHSLSRSRSHNKTISQHVGERIVLSDAYARARPCLSDERTCSGDFRSYRGPNPFDRDDNFQSSYDPIKTRTDGITQLREISRSHSAQIALSQLLGVDRSLVVAQISFSRSLDSHPCGHSTRTLAVTRLALCSHSTRTLAVTRLALLRSLDSLPCSHSTRSLAVTRLGSFSRSHSDCSQVSSIT